MGDGDETGGASERRPDRLLVAHLEVAHVDGDPGPLVDDRPGRPHGVDRLGEHDVAGRALRRQLDAGLALGGRRQLRASRRAKAISRSAGSFQPASSRSATSTARRSTVGPTPISRSRSWARMRRSRSFSSGDGSIPRPSTSASLRAPERPQRLGLPAGAVQGEHVHRPEVLAERMLDGQRVQLGDHLAMPAGPHVGVDARLERGQAKLGEAGDLAVEVPVRFDVGVRVAAPHRQRLAQPGRHIVARRPSPTAVRYASSNAAASIVASVQSSEYASPWRTITSPRAWRRFET